MSLKVMTWVFHESTAKGIDKLVLLAIADHAHDDGASAYPGMRLLAKKAGVGIGTVCRAIERLSTLGELEVTDRQTTAQAGAKVGRGTKLAYRIVMDSNVPERNDPKPKVPGRNDKKVPGRNDPGQERSTDDSKNVPLRASPIEDEPSLSKNRKSAPPASAPGPETRSATAGAILKQWIDSLPERPPGREVGQLAKTVRGLLDDGIASGLIWQTLDQDYRHRDVGPAYLPNLVAARQRGATRTGYSNGHGHVDQAKAEEEARRARELARAATVPERPRPRPTEVA